MSLKKSLMNFKKIYLPFLFIIILIPQLLQSIVIDDFDRISPSDYYLIEGQKSKLELFFSTDERFEGKGSMKITRNIPLDGNWAAYNAFYHHFGKDLLQDWSDKEYFVFWMKDVSNNVDSRIILKLNDNDEEWQCQRSIIKPGWQQYVMRVKQATGANPDYQLNTDGFYVPLWFKNSPGYHGNGILDMNTIFGFVFIFTGPNEIKGDIYIDNFKLVQGYEYTIPEKDSIINRNLTELKIIFGPRIDKSSLIPANIKINDVPVTSISYDSNINTAICQLPFSLSDNMVYTVSVSSIKINSSFPMTLDNYQWNFLTGDSGRIGKNSIYRTVQLLDGTSLTISPGAVSEDIVFSIQKLENIDRKTYNKFLKSSGLYYKFNPENINFKKPCKITIFYDETLTLSEDKLKIYRLGENGWELIGGEVNPEGNYISVNVNQLGIFTVMEDSYTYVKLGEIQKPSSNPFTPNGDGINDVVKFKFTVYKDNSSVTLIIYNTLGYKVKEIAKDKKVRAGGNIEEWDGRDDAFQFLPTGIYIYELKISDPDDINNVVIQRGAISLIRN